MANFRPVPWSLIGLCAVSSGASAQVERSGGGPNAQIMQQYQQLAAERTHLQSENARLSKELDDAKKELKTATGQLATFKARGDASQTAITAAQAAKNASEQSLKVAKDKLKELADHFRETAGTLRDVETKRAQLEQQLGASGAKYDQCAVRNEELAKISEDVLKRYEKQGFFTRAARTEPFARITQTRVENLVDEYRERAEELRLKKSGAEPAAQPAAAPAPPAPVVPPATQSK